MASGRSVLWSPQTVRGVCRQRRRSFPGGILIVAAEKSGTVLSLHHQCSNSGRRRKRCVRKCRKRIERDFAPTRSIVLPFLQHGKCTSPRVGIFIFRPAPPLPPPPSVLLHRTSRALEMAVILLWAPLPQPNPIRLLVKSDSCWLDCS